jgi:hypothetical protein
MSGSSSPQAGSHPGMNLHAALAPLAALVGTWEGEGAGQYPTVAPFRYRERVSFTAGSGPFLVYAQRTWSSEDGRPLHAETGYWRVPSRGRVEAVLVSPTGVAEVQEGSVSAGRLRLRSSGVLVTATAKAVERLERDLDVDGDVLVYALRMAAVGQPLGPHLAATLRRCPG